MASPKTIALDAMGGDHGPEVIVPGAALSLAAKSRVIHTDLVIAMDEKPSQALHPAR